MRSAFEAARSASPASTIDRIYRLAGLGFHADRLRTPVGSRSGEVDPGPVEEEPSDEEPQGSESEDEPAPVTEETDASASSAPDTT